MVDSFRESFFSNSRIGISSVRAGNVIGGGDWAQRRIIPDLVRGMVKGELQRPDLIKRKHIVVIITADIRIKDVTEI